MRASGSVDAVLAALRGDAAAELERTEREAAEQTARLETDEPPAEAPTDREARLAAARRAAREKVAREEWADARAAIEAREHFVQRAAAEGRRLLAAPGSRDERQALLARLAREALALLPGDRFEVLVAPADAPLLDGVLDRKATVVASPEIENGCLVRSEDGRARFDNTLAERARRFEPSWRAAVARVYGP